LPATPVALVGHAGGAAVAIAVAARSPLVERLVVIAGGPDGGANAASAGISAPILVVTGGRDAAPTVGARHEHRADIDSGRAVLAERPAEVLRYVDAFLEGVALWPVTP
jgi:dienelactone hydrolase